MRKQFAWLMAASLFCGMLGGCGSSSASDGAQSSAAASASSSAAAENASASSAAAESSIVLPENMTENELLEQIVTLHGCYDHEADDKVNALLKELGSRDERKGKLWTDIMKYWD